MINKNLDKKPEVGYELDALVAEYVLHWPVQQEFCMSKKHIRCGRAYNCANLWEGSPKYSSAGWIVANELGANGYLVAMYQDFGTTWDVRADYGDEVFSERSDNPMYALCLVALKTVGFTWPEDEDA